MLWDHCFTARLFRLTVLRGQYHQLCSVSVTSHSVYRFFCCKFIRNGWFVSVLVYELLLFDFPPSFSSYSYCPCSLPTSLTTLTFRFTNCISMTSQYKLLIILRYIDYGRGLRGGEFLGRYFLYSYMLYNLMVLITSTHIVDKVVVVVGRWGR